MVVHIFFYSVNVKPHAVAAIGGFDLNMIDNVSKNAKRVLKGKTSHYSHHALCQEPPGERAGGSWHRDDELKINFSISFTQEGSKRMKASMMNT